MPENKISGPLRCKPYVKKRRRAPAPRRTPVTLPGEEGLKAVYITEYEITDEPILDRFYKQLPDSVKDAFERLHDESQTQPLKAIPELLEWIEKYPQLPMLYNYLSVAYSQAGQHDKMEATILENYRRNLDLSHL